MGSYLVAGFVVFSFVVPFAIWCWHDARERRREREKRAAKCRR